MTATATIQPNIAAIDDRPPAGVARCEIHATGYHVRCSRCGAQSVAATDRDAMRICCPACMRQLTLPANIEQDCPACRAANTFPHHLAGHSAACTSCGRAMTLDPIVGQAKSRHRARPARVKGRRRQRTLAFADAAERSLFIVAAAIGTLIFLIARSIFG
jgi:hypothetical protein